MSCHESEKGTVMQQSPSLQRSEQSLPPRYIYYWSDIAVLPYSLAIFELTVFPQELLIDKLNP